MMTFGITALCFQIIAWPYTSILDKPLRGLIAGCEDTETVPEAVAIYVAHVASLAYELARRAPRAAIVGAAASGSSSRDSR